MNPDFVHAFATAGKSVPTMCELHSSTTLDTKPEISASLTYSLCYNLTKEGLFIRCCLQKCKH